MQLKNFTMDRLFNQTNACMSKCWVLLSYVQLFWERLSEEICTRQARKVIWDMINTLFLTLQLSNLLFFAFLSTREQTSMVSRAILSNFFDEQWAQNHPQYLSGLSRVLFPTTFLEIVVYQLNDWLNEITREKSTTPKRLSCSREDARLNYNNLRHLLQNIRY